MEDELNDVIDFALNKQPVDFQSAINDMLQAKAVEAIDSIRHGVASSMFGSDDENDYVPEDNEDEDFDDGDWEDDFDDIDLDADLEGLEDDEQDS